MARKPKPTPAPALPGGPDETLEGVILAALTEAEPNGLTVRGIEAATGRHQASVAGALQALAARGRVRDSGRKAKFGKSRAAPLWALGPA